MSPIDILLRSNLDDKGFQNVKKQIEEVKTLGKSAESILAGIGQGLGQRLAGLFTAIPDALTNAVKEGIAFNATIEQSEVAFGTLLQSTTAAQKRIEELYEFAKNTPFEFDEIVRANRLLQSLGGNALASAAGMRMVGDAAAANGRPLEMVAEHLGRVFAGLQGGSPIGESTQQLVRMGIISVEAGKKMNELAESGKGAGQAFTILQAELKRFDGGMEKLAKTFNGLLSTLSDLKKQAAGQGTKEIFESLKYWMSGVAEVVGSDKFQMFLKWVTDTSWIGNVSRLSRAVGEMVVPGDTSAPPPKAKDIPGPPSRAKLLNTVTKTEAQQKAMAELREQTVEEQLENEAEKIEFRYSKERQQIIETFKAAKDQQDALALLDQKYAAIRRKHDEELEQKRREDAVRRHQHEVETDLQFHSRMLAGQREGFALQRAIIDADFTTTEVEKRKQRLESMEQELHVIDQMLQKLQEKHDLEQDAASRELIGAQMNDLRGERARLGTDVEIQGGFDPESFSDQFDKTITDLQNQWGTAAEQMANSFRDVFNSAISTISNGITGLIMGTQTWGQALLNIGVSILQSIIQAIVQMGVRWVMTQMMMAVAGKAIQTSMVAANAPLAAAASAIWATPATLATIASYGAAAAAAPAFITAAQGMVMASSMIGGFKEGGYTGDGDPNAVAGVAHRGEFYFSAPQTRAIGKENLARLASGAAMGGGGGGIAAALQGISSREPAIDASVNIAPVMSPDMIGHWFEETRGRKVVVDIARQVVLEMQQS